MLIRDKNKSTAYSMVDLMIGTAILVVAYTGIVTFYSQVLRSEKVDRANTAMDDEINFTYAQIKKYLSESANSSDASYSAPSFTITNSGKTISIKRPTTGQIAAFSTVCESVPANSKLTEFFTSSTSFSGQSCTANNRPTITRVIEGSTLNPLPKTLRKSGSNYLGDINESPIYLWVMFDKADDESNVQVTIGGAYATKLKKNQTSNKILRTVQKTFIYYHNNERNESVEILNP